MLVCPFTRVFTVYVSSSNLSTTPHPLADDELYKSTIEKGSDDVLPDKSNFP